MTPPLRLLCPAVMLLLSLWPRAVSAELIRVATYNLEGYLDVPAPGRPAKSAESKAKIRESIRALNPDVLALQEIGSTNALLELRDGLKAEGLELPYWEHVGGFDTNIHVAILSRFPFAACRPHTNESYLLSGRRFHVSRGFGEVDIQVNPSYAFILLTAHLKSKRLSPQADENEMRLEEAKLLREKIDARLAANPNANLVVLGDFNDTQETPALKAILGRGKNKLLDTRPAERNGDEPGTTPLARTPRTIAWTHYYDRDDTYSRLDYLLLSPGMAREWVPAETFVLSLSNWGLASDHRPLVAAFETADQ